MTYSETSMRDALDQIMTDPAPIIFPDTCALIDLIRLPIRINNPHMAEEIVNTANHLVSCAQHTPPQLWIIILPVIRKEWHEHSQRTMQETQQHWSDLDTQIKVAHATATSMNIALSPATVYAKQQIESGLVRLSQAFLAHALFLPEDADCIQRAYRRVVNKDAPARKGGGMQDCTIIEHCFTFCHQLRDAGFTKKCVFTTSNTKDFCKPGSTTEVNESLAAQFNAIPLSLTTNWRWTRAALGL